MARRRTLGPGISFFAFQDIITAVVGIFILITLILVLELAQRVEAASEGNSVDVAPIVESIEMLEQEVARLRGIVQQRSETAEMTETVNAFSRAEQVEQLRDQYAAAKMRLSQVKSQLQRLETETNQADNQAKSLTNEAIKLKKQRALIEQLAEKMRQLQAKINRLSGDTSPMYRDETEDGRFVTLVTLDGTRIELRDALTQASESFVGARRVDQVSDWMRTVSLKQRQLYILVKPGGAADFGTLQQRLDAASATYGFNVVAADADVRLGFEVE